jgi:hypothetical protein
MGRLKASTIIQSKITLAVAPQLTDKKIQHGESASNIGRRGRSERADWRNVPQITQFDGPDAQLASIKA